MRFSSKIYSPTVALFVPQLKVAESLTLRCSNDLEVSLLWQRSESVNCVCTQICLYRRISKFENFIFFVQLILISPPRWCRTSPTECGPANYRVARITCNSVPDSLQFMLAYCVLLYLLDILQLTKKYSHIVTVWNLASSLR